MTTEENKLLVRRYVEEVWNGHDASLVDEFFAPDYERHLSPSAPPFDAEGQRLRIEVESVFGEGDLVTFRATIRGTREVEFAGVAPTGRRVEGERFAEHWGGPDMLDLLGQLGAYKPHNSR